MSRLAADLCGRGFDVLTTEDAGKNESSDEEQLAFATAQGRAILTFNIRDFALLHEQWREENKAHAGIVVPSKLAVVITASFCPASFGSLTDVMAESLLG